MAEVCVKIGCPQAIRLTLQDPCTGEPVPGAANGAYIQCGRNTTLEKALRDEETSEFVADCGPSERYVQEASLQGFNLSFEITNFSPQTEALLTGSTLLTSGTDNVGVLYEAGQGCTTTVALPRFTAEVFFQTRGACATGTAANYVRFVIPSIRFSPTEIDTEGQIRIVRYTGTSDAAPVSGLLANGDGPYDDFTAGLVTSLTALDDTPYYGFWEADPIVDPAAGSPLVTGTCYTVAVPAATP